MSGVENAIKRAIEGGYKKGEIETNNDGVWLSNSDFTLHQSDIILDPLFWQALGKSEGWSEGVFIGGIQQWRGSGWWIKWHDFIDHLASGGTPDHFFNELLTT